MSSYDVPVPTLWLIGKTGSGKSSIIRYLTGATDTEIGTGYRPCTKNSRLYSFPDDQFPLLRFLDTRGLGEAGYDPADDLAAADTKGELTLVTVRAADHATDAIFKPFQQFRRAKPLRPAILVLTCLHDAYPGKPHPMPYPFGNSENESEFMIPEHVSDDLRRSMELQVKRWHGLVDRIVAVDLTPIEDGFNEPAYGGEQLKNAIIELLPATYRHTLIEMDKLSGSFASAHQHQAARIILSRSIVAATAAAVPVPWIDIPFVLGVQANLAHRLAAINRHKLDAKTMANVSAAIGGRVALRMGLREVLKIVPWFGAVANATAAFAMTYATGWAWNWYFMQVSKGHIPASEELRQVYTEQLQMATKLWKSTHSDATRRGNTDE